jgi:hypothetical protein
MGEDGKRDKVFTSRQIQFARWLCLPKNVRQPRTQRALAQVWGMNECTLSEWKHLPGFSDLVHEETMVELASGWPQVVHSMIREGAGGNVEAAKFVGKLARRYGDKLELTGAEGKPLTIHYHRGEAK